MLRPTEAIDGFEAGEQYHDANTSRESDVVVQA